MVALIASLTVFLFCLEGSRMRGHSWILRKRDRSLIVKEGLDTCARL